MTLSQFDLRFGDLIAFQLGERSHDEPSPNKDRWGVFRVLDPGHDSSAGFSISVRDGIWDACPGFWAAGRRSVLTTKEFYPGQIELDVGVIYTTGKQGALNFRSPRKLGRWWFNSKLERAALSDIRAQGYCRILAGEDYGETCLDRKDWEDCDPEGFAARVKAREDELRVHAAGYEDARAERLHSVTLEQLANERQFEDWHEEGIIVDEDFAKALRELCKQVLAELIALGAGPLTEDVRACLRGFMEKVSALDQDMGQIIMTEEREEIMFFVEEVCFAVKQEGLYGEVDDWRRW